MDTGNHSPRFFLSLCLHEFPQSRLGELKMTSLQMCNFTSANRCYFKNVIALFTSMECWAERLFVRFRKNPLLAELQAKTSKGCRILLFQHHSYMVTLRWSLRVFPGCQDSYDLGGCHRLYGLGRHKEPT